MRQCTANLLFFGGMSLTLFLTVGECYFDIDKFPLKEGQSYCKMSSSFCPSMISHLVTIVLMYTIVLIDTTMPRNYRLYNIVQKIVDCVMTIINLSFFVTMVIYYYFYVDYYNSMEIGCLIQRPYVVFTTGLIFSFYMIFAIALVIFCVCGIYILFKSLVKKDKFEKKMKKLLQNVYFDKDQITNFYEANEEQLKDIPLYPIEVAVFKDQFETEFRFTKNKSYSECCICYFDSFREDQKVIFFPGCHHNFHFECLNEWVKKRTKCPICRAEFRTGFPKDLCDKMNGSFMKVNSGEEQNGLIA